MINKFSHGKILTWADSHESPQSFILRVIHAIFRIVFITVREFRKNELSLRAGALTYTILLSLVPILAMSTAVVKGLGGGDQLKKVVYSYVETLDQTNTTDSENDETTNPSQLEHSSSNLTDHLYSAVDKIFNYVDRTNFATLGTIGVIGIFLSVVLVLGNIEAAMNAIWNVESGRSVMRKIADYLALLVLMPISINVGFAASAVLKSEALLSKFSILLPMIWVQALILKLIPIFFLTLTLYVIYLFFPQTKVKSVSALTGALFASFFWFEVQNIYIGLQVGVSKYNAIYGSFATLPLFLIWLYFGLIFILTGAQIGFAVQNRNSYQLQPDDTKSSHRLSIAFDVMDYVQKCFNEESTASQYDFLEKYPMHQQKPVNETIIELINAKLIHHSADDGSLKPSSPCGKAVNGRIIDAILGSSFSPTDGGRKSSKALQSASYPPPNPVTDDTNTPHMNKR